MKPNKWKYILYLLDELKKLNTKEVILNIDTDKLEIGKAYFGLKGRAVSNYHPSVSNNIRLINLMKKLNDTL